MQKKYRLVKRDDFNKVYRFGKSVANRQFVLYVMKRRETEAFRLGVSVSKKVGNAVVRNRIKRLIKEIVRANRGKIPEHYDLIIIARKPSAGMEYDQMEKSILHILRKSSLLNKEG
ncbi:ribonuclease P protein component [Ferviditalea candida]|uniref:Ribonuclease P protein component n=1 Tax=Ferviditalea candida TaxID=3108399 RepID=A0ABU5ZLT9_9BACL|nr:ribonuclease P protein component [Paenibacillaceae bacterium T2]